MATKTTHPAVAFLERYRPKGPWVLTAIRPDRKRIDTQTFTGRQKTALAKWVAGYNGEFNIYFHVNPTREAMTKKAEREHIAALEWLHVDIDPRPREDIEEERARALRFLTERLPDGVPPPTAIIFSGGGYQGFWRLAEPVPLDGSIEAAEDAKRWNQALELKFGADQCHNIDRIMRLPGTINVPDVKKAKAGRVPTPAELVEFHDDRVYPISEFEQAPKIEEVPVEVQTSAPDVDPDAAVPRIEDVAELDEWGVPDKVKVAIVQGHHPDEPLRGKNGRSEWLLYVCSQLVKRDVPDAVIFGIITDPAWGIAESVLDKGSATKRYALRQIRRAKEQSEHPKLREFNDRFFVVESYGGRCRIGEEIADECLDRTRLVMQSFQDFRNRWSHLWIEDGVDKEGKPKSHQLGHWWLGHPRRRQFLNIVFAPGRDAPGRYNLWQGFSVEPLAGECGLYLEHLRENVCGGRQDLFHYVLAWLARAVQHPDKPGEVALVLRGGRGVGKGSFANEFGRIFGRHYLQVSNSAHLASNFNSHLRDLVVLFADEAFFAGDKKHESILKTLITEATMAVEAKGVDIEAAPNYVHLIMASNDQHVVPAGSDERRYLVLDVGEGRKKDTKFFSALRREMEDGGREALLYILMNYDLAGYQVRDIPATGALVDQKILSMSDAEQWWYTRLREGRVLPSHNQWERLVPKDDVVGSFGSQMDQFRRFYRGTETSFGMFLKRVCGPGISKKVKGRPNYLFPDLDTCRANWERIYGFGDWTIEELPPQEAPVVYDEERPPF